MEALGQTLQLLNTEGAGAWVLMAAFIFGSCWGSFIQACYYRIPRGISIVHPPSSCPNCGQHLKLWDNVPILGWLCLRGRCRYCAVKIPLRYLWVEALCGGLATILCRLYFLKILAGSEASWLFAAALLFLLLAKIDLTYGILPDGLVLPPLLLFLGTGWNFNEGRDQIPTMWPFGVSLPDNMMTGILGTFVLVLMAKYSLPAIRGSVWIFCGAPCEEVLVKRLAKWGWLNQDGEPKNVAIGLVFLILGALYLGLGLDYFFQSAAYRGCIGGWILMQTTRVLGKKINNGQEALGLGDIKLVALLGYLLTSSALLPMLGLACCLGLLLAALNYGLKLKTALPFGPALCASAWIVLLIRAWLPL